MIALNSTIQKFESFLPNQRWPNSYLGYLNHTLAIIYSENSTIQILNVSHNRENCSTSYILDVTEDCNNQEDGYICPNSKLIYCCTECNSTNDASYCYVYGEKASSGSLLLSSRLYLNQNNINNTQLQMVTIDSYNNSVTRNENCYMTLIGVDISSVHSGISQNCYR